MSGTTATQTAFSYQRQNFKNRGIEDVPIDEDAPRRIAASNYAAAFVALMIVSGINSKLREGLLILLNKTRGYPFDKAVEFSDLSAGTLLSNETEEEVTDDAIKKRWKRFCESFEKEQARLNKRVFYRMPGKPIYERKAIIGFQPSSYKSHLAQMIVDIARRARSMRNRKLTRDERFRLAAIEVWNLLPPYDEKTKLIKLPNEKSPNVPTISKLTTKIFKDADHLIKVLKKKDLATYNRKRMEILCELETKFADGESELENGENSDRGDKNVTLLSQNEKKIVQNAEENRNFSDSLSVQLCTLESDVSNEGEGEIKQDKSLIAKAGREEF